MRTCVVPKSKKFNFILIGAATFGCFINIFTEPLIRYYFKVLLLGIPHEIAYLSSINCAISMFASAIPSIFLAFFLYKALERSLLKKQQYIL